MTKIRDFGLATTNEGGAKCTIGVCVKEKKNKHE